MKVFLSVILAVLLVSLKGADGTFDFGTQAYLPHNYRDCKPDIVTTGLKEWHHTVQVEGRFWRRVQQFVNFPEDGISDKAIQCIIVKDLSLNGKGGYVTTVKGGVGSNFVILNLKSRLGQGLQFDVAIYTLK